MSNWCMGCGRVIGDGDYCFSCSGRLRFRAAHYEEPEEPQDSEIDPDTVEDDESAPF